MGSSGGVAGGSGGVAGPGASTDNAVTRFDGTDGQTLQSSPIVISDAGAVSGATLLTIDNLSLDGNTLSTTNTNGDLILDPDGTGNARLASGLLQFGGTSSSFPAVRNSGAGLEVRLADNSNYTTLAAIILAALDDSGNYRFKAQSDVGAILGSGAQLLWSSSSGLGGVTTGDTGIRRESAGVQLDTNGSSGLGARLTGRVVEASTAGSGAPNLLSAVESRKLLTNEGATAEAYHTLPTAAAGIEFVFVCLDADGIRVVANTGDTIQLGTTVSAAGGYVRSSTPGSSLTLVAVNATEWVATSIVGTWTVDT